jgi:uncharacterized protein (DUF1330 family)
MSVYFIAELRVHDQAAYQRYLDDFDDAFEGTGGEVVLVDESPTVLEGSWPYTRVVLIRFPDEASLRSWYNSDAYRRLRAIRQRAADGRIIIAHEEA